MPIFSIIIPFQGHNPFLAEALDRIEALSGPSFEVILLPDGEHAAEAFGTRPYPLRLVPTGPVSPAIKRDKGAEAATTQFLAFIDDDAYPAPDWLERVLERFDEGVAAVGGPQLTPADDGFARQVSGAVFISPLSGRALARYWPVGPSRDVDDWPTVNLTVRREDFLAAGGFDSAYWPGEDTKLCHDLVHKLGKRIVYAPDALVYHHRRGGFTRHMRQVGNYGRHRGHFVRKFPRTSLRPSYFMPSAFFLFATAGWLAVWAGGVWSLAHKALWTTYGLALCISFGTVWGRVGNWRVALAAQAYLAATHFWYGLNFLRGLLSVGAFESRLGR